MTGEQWVGNGVQETDLPAQCDERLTIGKGMLVLFLLVSPC
jgi:hypothetical protein